MTRYRVSFSIEVDDAALAEHDGDHSPPPNDPLEWVDTDLFAAEDLGIVELDHAEIDIEVEK